MDEAEKLVAVAENVQKGLELNQQLTNILCGVDTGGKGFYDEFWDSLQRNGTEFINYGYMFSNKDLWTQENIEKVKYKHLKANYFSVVFSNNSSITDLSSFSFESPTNQWGERTQLTLSTTFGGCTALIKCMPINCDMVYSFVNTFKDCSELEELPVSGTLKTNGFDVHWSTKLNKTSITSIINALSSTTSGLTVTISKAAKEAAFTDEEWAVLEATKPNWTISLV